jgi:ABC-type Fe3+-hydroxamate transport system substrate-binding protein
MMLIITVGTVLALIPFTMTVSAQTADPASTAGDNNMTEAKFLFIQSAESGSVSQVNATTSTLELRDVSDKTISFADRPNRIVASENTTNLVGNWSMGGPNSFAADPPNAVLILDDEEQREDFGVIELFNPEYDPVANTLKYDITAENATTTTTTTTTTPSINLPGEFGQSTLVIDDDDGPIMINKHTGLWYTNK